MKLTDLSLTIDGVILVGAKDGELEIDRAYAADLLSDVLALTDESTTLVTGTISLQVMRVAEILGITAVIFVRGKRPPRPLIEYAERLGIPLVVTKKTMFETCGLMYANGVRPCKNRPVSEPRATIA
jgi:hypothetical protein